MIGIWLVAIPESSKQKTEAFDFMQFLTDYKMQLEMATAYGLPPTRKSVYGVSALSAKYPWYPAQLDALNNGVARTRTTKWKEIEDQLGSVLQLALLGNLSAEEALKNAETAIKAVLQ
jgi:multiple sugar transport system substrate-binding protein